MNIEGDFLARAVKPEIGTNKSGKPKVRIEFEILEGQYKGRRVAYDGKLDPENIKYTKRDMVACGWRGESVSTFVADVEKANLSLPISVKVASWKNPDTGKINEWSAVQRIGSGAAPLNNLDAEKTRDVDSWFREAGDIAPPSARQPADDSDLPF